MIYFNLLYFIERSSSFQILPIFNIVLACLFQLEELSLLQKQQNPNKVFSMQQKSFVNCLSLSTVEDLYYK